MGSFWLQQFQQCDGLTDGRIYGLTWVGARDTCVSKNYKYRAHQHDQCMFHQEALGLENGFRVRLREDGLLAAFIVLLLLAAVASLAIAKCCTSADGKRTKMDWVEIEQLNTPTNDFPPLDLDSSVCDLVTVCLCLFGGHIMSPRFPHETQLYIIVEANIKQPNYAVWVYFLSYICTSFGHFHKKAVV